MSDDNTTNLTVVCSELEPCRMKVDIEVPPQRVRAEYEDVLKTFHGAARIPGFRPGKSPRKLLERKYRSEISEETVRRLVNRCTDEAIKSEDVRPETQPRLENEDSLAITDPDQPFVYSATFDVAPSFTLPDYRNLRIRRRPSGVDDEAVDNFLERIFQQRASYESVDRPAQHGDQLRVSYTGKVRGVDAAELPETARFLLEAKDNWLPLRDPEMLPGANEQLAGCTANSEVAMEIAFPESFVESSLAGKVADYSVTIHDVQTQHTPELTDETAQSMFGMQTAAEVRASVRQHLEREDEQNRHRGLRDDLLEQLLEGQDFAVPPSLLAREAYDLFRSRLEQEYRRAPQQVQDEDYQKQLWEQVSEEARQRLRRQYILRRIADEEQIEVSSEEFEQTLEQMAKAYRLSAKMLRRRLSENNRLVDVFMDIRENKTVEHLLELVEVVEPDTE